MLSLLMAGCTSGGTVGDGPTDANETDVTTHETGTTTPPTDSTTTETGIGTGSTGDTADPCAVLPAIPVTWNVYGAFETSEDFDIDGDGYLCSNIDNNLACRDFYGNTKIVSPGIVTAFGTTAGIRILPDGNWLFNDVGRGALMFVDAKTGGKIEVAGGINYPNGLEVSRDGKYAFIGENGDTRVRQIEIATGAQHIAAEGLAAPNGVILSPDEQTLYVGSFGGGIIYAVDRIDETTWDTPRTLYDPSGNDGGFDGINVDSCGNVYITEYIYGVVYRLTDDGGLGNGTVADLPESWIPNMRWGHDIGGWESDVMYVTAWGSVYGLEMGIEGKKHVLMP